MNHSESALYDQHFINNNRLFDFLFFCPTLTFFFRFARPCVRTGCYTPGRGLRNHALFVLEGDYSIELFLPEETGTAITDWFATGNPIISLAHTQSYIFWPVHDNSINVVSQVTTVILYGLGRHDQLVSQPLSQSVNQSVSQSVSLSVSRSVSQSVSQSVRESVSQSDRQSFSHSLIVAIFYIFFIHHSFSQYFLIFILGRAHESSELCYPFT